jgi:aromatic ring-opening dioxygenase catalytic subunit (LigB family)
VVVLEPEVPPYIAAQPELIYDYYGSPPESYQIRYPEPGAPEMALRIADVRAEHSIDCSIVYNVWILNLYPIRAGADVL